MPKCVIPKTKDNDASSITDSTTLDEDLASFILDLLPFDVSVTSSSDNDFGYTQTPKASNIPFSSIAVPEEETPNVLRPFIKSKHDIFQSKARQAHNTDPGAENQCSPSTPPQQKYDYPPEDDGLFHGQQAKSSSPPANMSRDMLDRRLIQSDGNDETPVLTSAMSGESVESIVTANHSPDHYWFLAVLFLGIVAVLDFGSVLLSPRTMVEHTVKPTPVTEIFQISPAVATVAVDTTTPKVTTITDNVKITKDLAKLESYAGMDLNDVSSSNVVRNPLSLCLRGGDVLVHPAMTTDGTASSSSSFLSRLNLKAAGISPLAVYV